VHHGLPLDLHQPTFYPRGGYLAFLGRISPEKRPDRAIALARATGMPLKIAAKVDKVDETYFQEVIAPLLQTPEIEFIGEIDERAKTDFLGQAAALLFPIDWPEPFGLVLLEAMACATPVLAFHRGSVPEIVEDGVTGRIVSNLDDAVRAMSEVLSLERRIIRQRFRAAIFRGADGKGLCPTLSRYAGQALSCPSCRVELRFTTRRATDAGKRNVQELVRGLAAPHCPTDSAVFLAQDIHTNSLSRAAVDAP